MASHPDSPKDGCRQSPTPWLVSGLLTKTWTGAASRSRNTPGQLYHWSSPKLSKAENAEDTAQPAAGSSTGCIVALPSDSVGLNLFRAIHWLSAPSRQLVWPQSPLCNSPLSESNSQLLLCTLTGRASWTWSLSGTSWSCFALFMLREFPCRMECFSLRGNWYNECVCRVWLYPHCEVKRSLQSTSVEPLQ